MRKIGALDKEGKGLLLIEWEGLEKKKDVMEAKSKLRGEKIRVEDNLTYEERRIKKIVMEEAFKEKAAGKNVKVGYMKLWVWNHWMWKGKEIEEVDKYTYLGYVI